MSETIVTMPLTRYEALKEEIRVADEKTIKLEEQLNNRCFFKEVVRINSWDSHRISYFSNIDPSEAEEIMIEALKTNEEELNKLRKQYTDDVKRLNDTIDKLDQKLSKMMSKENPTVSSCPTTSVYSPIPNIPKPRQTWWKKLWKTMKEFFRRII